MNGTLTHEQALAVAGIGLAILAAILLELTARARAFLEAADAACRLSSARCNRLAGEVERLRSRVGEIERREAPGARRPGLVARRLS